MKATEAKQIATRAIIDREREQEQLNPEAVKDFVFFAKTEILKLAKAGNFNMSLQTQQNQATINAIVRKLRDDGYSVLHYDLYDREQIHISWK